MKKKMRSVSNQHGIKIEERKMDQPWRFYLCPFVFNVAQAIINLTIIDHRQAHRWEYA